MFLDAYSALSWTMLLLPILLVPIWYALYYYLCGDDSPLGDSVKGVIALGVFSAARVVNGEAKAKDVRILLMIDCIFSAGFLMLFFSSLFFYYILAAILIIGIVSLPEIFDSNESAAVWVIAGITLFIGVLV